jgi:hypothetical protein
VDNTFYHIGTDDAVYLGHGVAGTGFFRLGGQVKQISAGATLAGTPEVFVIGFNDTVSVNNGSGYVNLGGYFKQISATMQNMVYAIGGDNAVYENSGGGWVSLGGYATQISAGFNATFGPRVYSIGLDDALYLNFGSGFVRQGGYVTEVSTPAVGVALPSDLAYVVGQGHGGFLHQETSFNPITGGTIE